MTGFGASTAVANQHTRHRVLVVDDSAFMRRLISDVVNADDGFEVVATARDGEDALRKVRSLDPDIVTLDVVMPGVDGLEALRRIMHELPRPVVMLSAGSDDGAASTLRALELGAVDFVRKPSGPISLDLGRVRDHLLDALRAAASAQHAATRVHVVQAAEVEEHRSEPPARRNDQVRRGSATSPRWIVCVASSTGGPAALTRIIPVLEARTDVAYIVVQHLPGSFTTSLAQRLDNASRMPVLEVQDEMPVLGGHVYIAQGGRHLEIASASRIQFMLNDSAPLWGVRPAADPLFESAAALFGERAIGVVLTGMGRDGAAGLKSIRDNGGIGIVQDRESSIVPGMPVAAREHAGSDHVVSLEDMSSTIERSLMQMMERVP